MRSDALATFRQAALIISQFVHIQLEEAELTSEMRELRDRCHEQVHFGQSL